MVQWKNELCDPPIKAQYALDLIFKSLIDDKENYEYLTTMSESTEQTNSIMLAYRGIGIGQKLVEEYISRYNTADVVAAMALYNPVFEKSGMKRVKDVEIKPPKGLSTILKINKFDCSKWYIKDYCMVFISDNLTERT